MSSSNWYKCKRNEIKLLLVHLSWKASKFFVGNLRQTESDFATEGRKVMLKLFEWANLVNQSEPAYYQNYYKNSIVRAWYVYPVLNSE